MNNVMIGIMIIEMVVLILVNLKKDIFVNLYLIWIFILLLKWLNVPNVLRIVKIAIKINVSNVKVVILSLLILTVLNASILLLL